MSTTAIKPQVNTELRDWKDTLNQLIDDIERWAQDRHWPVHRHSKKIKEDGLGTYTVPVLGVLAPSGHIQINPVARRVCGCEGRVDIFAWPTMNRMVLVRDGASWKLKTEDGKSLRQAWGPRAFLRVVDLLNSQPE